MMWLVPAVVIVLAAIPILIAVRRVAVEAVELRREVHRFSELRPALLELRSDTRALRRGLAARADQFPRR